MPTYPDPVSEGQAYRAALLALVGTDDPLDVQAETAGLLRAIVADAGDRLRTRPEEREWSPIEVLGHVVDAEMVYSARYRWILAHDEPTLIGYDQDLWVERLGHGAADPEELLTIFETLRRANLALWRRTDPSERPRAGLHAERGPETYGESFALIAGHDRFHLEQARRAISS